MRALIWTISLVALGLWSLLAWGAAGLLGSAETLGTGMAGDPLGLGVFLPSWVDTLGLVGTSAIWIVWAVGALLLLLGTLLLSRTVRAVSRRLGRARSGAGGRLPSLNDGRASPSLGSRLMSRARPRVRTLRR